MVVRDGLYPCTAADPMGTGSQQGLLGEGSLPWPSVVAARAFPSSLDIAGTYATDDLSAAEFLINELSSPEAELSPEETEDYYTTLIFLFGKLKKAPNVAAKQFLELKEKAEKIPVIGSPLFSTANLPGTLASVGGILHAGSKATKVEDLLDLSKSTKTQLKKWAASRGKPGSVSAHRAFRGRIKLIRVGGNLYFEIPATAKASIYRVGGNVVGNTIHVPAYNAAKTLRSTAHVDGDLYGQRGVGKMLVGKAAGPILAFGPQLVMDINSATSGRDFLKKTAYSQPTNALVFASGVAIGATVSAPAVLVIAIGLGVGLVIQIVMSDDVSGWGTSLGNLLTGKD
ncbi:hypothetical protein ALQ76_03967 [Pseudomonas syringae pv. atrofaciens]|nr:hypothetical protein ALQ76_03967 [Pseudomonas syringae pv. atrofaciens]